MKGLLSFAVVLLLLSSTAFTAVMEDWNRVNPGQDTGTFMDTMGSGINFSVEDGPDGNKVIKLTSKITANGWCGIWRTIAADLSGNNSLRFKIKSSAAGEVQIALKDSYNVQYSAHFPVFSGDWTEVTVPFSTFNKDPYYTPPDAIPGHPMDLTMTKSMNLQPNIIGDSVVEIGPIEAVGTTSASAAPTPISGASSTSNARIIDDWFISPYQMLGTFADSMGSKSDAVLETGPDGQKAVKLTSSLVLGGWCGIGRNIPVSDLSKNTCFKFKIKSNVSGQVQMSLKDSFNVQYVTIFQVSPTDWTEVTVPFSSFQKDPYYTPPGAHLGHSMDLKMTKGISFTPKMTGDSILEIGQIEAAGTGGAFFDQTKAKTGAQIKVVKISRASGIPISPYAFGNCYFDWIDWSKNGLVGLKGTEDPVRAMKLSVIVGADNQNDANSPQLFDNAQEDKFIEYCRAVGAEPIMIVPVYGNNKDGGKTSAQGAADIVTYINGTKKYGVKYWSIGDEVDIYDVFFHRKTGLPVTSVSEYAAIYNSYARAMVEANEKAHSGVELKFVGPELGAKYNEGDDWLSTMLDECKDYIDIVSIHHYGFSARELTEAGVLNDINGFPEFIQDVKNRIAKHGKPGTQLAITEANACYDADTNLYTPETRRVGPGTFYAAIWDADRIGAALEAGLWTLAFWELAEPVQSANYNVFGFLLTDPLKNPPTYKLTPEYYTQQMVDTNFSGTSVKPSEAPESMSVYASYDAKKSATAILVINKDAVKRFLTLAVDKLKPRKIMFSPMSINIVTIPDDVSAKYHILEYTIQMADAALAPKDTR
jgi:hypothetical protein